MYHAFPYLTDSKDMLSLERQIELVSLALYVLFIIHLTHLGLVNPIGGGGQHVLVVWGQDAQNFMWYLWKGVGGFWGSWGPKELWTGLWRVGR